jgi:hypothetical protein
MTSEKRLGSVGLQMTECGRIMKTLTTSTRLTWICVLPRVLPDGRQTVTRCLLVILTSSCSWEVDHDHEKREGICE